MTPTKKRRRPSYDAEDNAKQRKIKAHYRLSLARDNVRSLTFSN